jgi:hypothetical protein
LGATSWIEEDEGTDHLPLLVGHGAAHGEAVAQVAHTRDDHQFQGIA